MKPFQRCISCVLCFFLLFTMTGCESKYPVKIETMDVLFRQIRQEHSAVVGIEMYYMPHEYSIDVVMKPYSEDEMYAILERIYDTVTGPSFYQEYLEDLKRQIGQQSFNGGSRSGLSVTMYEGKFLWAKEWVANFSPTYERTLGRYFDYWDGHVGPDGQFISNSEIKEKFAEN